MRTSLSLVALLALSAAAPGAVLTLTPNPADLNDLDHDYAYTWGINSTTAGLDLAGLPITRAVLVIKNISNWDWSANDLYVDLLDTASTGVRSIYDSNGGDYFASWAYRSKGVARTALVHYEDIPYYPSQTLTYTLDDAEMSALYSYIEHGNDFALGFDPDCHFYNSGVSLELTYLPTMPEPATLSLIGAGGVLLLGRRRKS